MELEEREGVRNTVKRSPTNDAKYKGSPGAAHSALCVVSMLSVTHFLRDVLLYRMGDSESSIGVRVT